MPLTLSSLTSSSSFINLIANIVVDHACGYHEQEEAPVPPAIEEEAGGDDETVLPTQRAQAPVECEDYGQK